MNFEEYVSERNRIFSKQTVNKDYMSVLWASNALGGEVGEFQNIVKKMYRDDGGKLYSKRLVDMVDELGDIMWYWLFTCDTLNIDPEVIMGNNMDKLKKRYNID